jgi:phosphohistidine phosphatase
MLFLVHHAQAVDALVDPRRPLSEAGRTAVDALARRARERGVRPDVIFHSGKLRARMTGEVFWRACNPLAALSAARGLQPDDPPQWIADTIAGDERTVMLVGHMPHIARLFELLTRDPAGRGFPAHGLVALARDEAGWSELWRDA